MVLTLCFCGIVNHTEDIVLWGDNMTEAFLKQSYNLKPLTIHVIIIVIGPQAMMLK